MTLYLHFHIYCIRYMPENKMYRYIYTRYMHIYICKEIFVFECFITLNILMSSWPPGHLFNINQFMCNHIELQCIVFCTVIILHVYKIFANPVINILERVIFLFIDIVLILFIVITGIYIYNLVWVINSRRTLQKLVIIIWRNKIIICTYKLFF